MKPIKDIQDAKTRLNRYRSNLKKRDQIVGLAQELYFMDRNRKSGFYSDEAIQWRDKVAEEYWETSNKPQNLVDVMTGILGGHSPQYKCIIPGNVSSTIPSRAEMFLDGAWRLNSRRQQISLPLEIVHQTVRDGSCGVRIYWTPDPITVEPQVIPNPDDEQGRPWVIHAHDQYSFPICIEVIDIKNLFPSGRGRKGKPFSEIFYRQERTLGDVAEEWGEDNPEIAKMTKHVRDCDMYTNKEEYLEWWGEDRDGVIWYAIIFRDKFIVEPTPTKYPNIPFVITGYKRGKFGDSSLEALPFLYPVFHALEKYEYVRSRSYRLIDIFANMNPYHDGDSPLHDVEGTWGKVLELAKGESIKFPTWPGQPPDVYREMDQIEQGIEEGSFTSAMFGQVPGGSSGYAISQMAGVDMIRADIPKANLELAFSSIADHIFGLMDSFAPHVHFAVVSQIKSRKLAAMLSGKETSALLVEAYIKPKQLNDEIRLATVGAQLASLPKPILSTKYILENYFGLNQPEEEIARRLDEEAMDDPIVRLMAIVDVLRESGSPYLPIVEAELRKLVGQAAMPQGGGGGPAQGGPPNPADIMQGLGLGLPQAVQGNPHPPTVGGNVREENGPSMETLRHGGPRPNERR